MRLRRLFKAVSKKITAILLAGVLYSNFYPALFSVHPVIASASLNIGISVDKATAGTGETITYTATVTNNGDQELNNLMVKPNIGANSTFKNGSGSASKNGNTISLSDGIVNDGVNLGVFPNGQSATVTWQVTVNGGVATGTKISGEVSADSDEITDARSATVETTVGQTGNPTLSPSKSADKSAATRGETVTYTLTVRNSGDVDLHDVMVVENMPQYLSYVNGSTSATKGDSTVSVVDAWIGSAGTGTNLGTLTPSQSASVTFRAIISNDAPEGFRIENVGQFNSNETPNWIQCAASVTVSVPQTHPAMAPSKSVDKSTAKRGETVTYTLTVRNSGDVDLHDVMVVENIPQYLEYIVGTSRASKAGNTVTLADNWLGASGTGTNLGTLVVGQSATVTFQAKIAGDAPNSRKIENVGQFKSNETPSWIQCAAIVTVVVDETPTPTPTPTPRAGDPALSLTKKIRYDNKEVLSVESSTHVFGPGEKVTYRLFVGNSGTGDSGKLTITDNLPNFLSWDSGDGSYDSGSNKINFDLGVLKGGESKTITYVAKVSDKLAPGLHSQQNTAVLYEEKGEKARSSTNIWVGTISSTTTGEILSAQAPAKLPVSGGGMELLQISGLVSMLAGGVGIKLRKFSLPKRITVPTSEITGKWF